MGRPSKLTPEQWDQIRKRLLAGEKAADLSREFKIGKQRISERFSERIGTVKAVANQLVSAEDALRSLPVTEQLAALTLADELRAISTHLASAAKYGAATAHRLSGIAHGKVQLIDDARPLDEESLKELKGISALTRVANDASSIALNLLAANKETVKDLQQPLKPAPQRIVVEVLDAGVPDA